MLSVIIPAYNEQEALPLTSAAVTKILCDAHIDFEIIFIDDGSNDDTWGKIAELHAQNFKIKGLRFSKNFGKDAAIFAGLAHCKGDCAVVMDCDLQHPAEKIVDMYRLWSEGYEIVEGVKNTRGAEGRMHRFSAGIFYRIMTKIMKQDMSNASDFKLLDRAVIDTLLKMPEHKMFFRALSSWVGYKSTTILYDVQERVGGKSKWSTASLIKYAVSSAADFTIQPIQMVTKCGALMLIISFVIGIWSLVDKIQGRSIEGMTTVIFLLLLIGSMIMISLGIIGYYIARIFEEVQARPRYIVKDLLDE